MKTVDQFFHDWEIEVFGFGYGTGDEPVITSLRTFLHACPDEGCYDYEKLELLLTPAVAWLLINTLCHTKIIEYGSSPRFGWLTKEGKSLRTYLINHTVEYITEFLSDPDYIPCSTQYCNCDEGKCINPFWPNYVVKK